MHDTDSVEQRLAEMDRLVENHLEPMRRMALALAEGGNVSSSEVDSVVKGALRKAVRKFDPAKGESFEAVAGSAVKSAMRTFIRRRKEEGKHVLALDFSAPLALEPEPTEEVEQEAETEPQVEPEIEREAEPAFEPVVPPDDVPSRPIESRFPEDSVTEPKRPTAEREVEWKPAPPPEPEPEREPWYRRVFRKLR